jgi:hypothetical protein
MLVRIRDKISIKILLMIASVLLGVYVADKKCFNKGIYCLSLK